jgi:hypothetical protein
VWARLFILDKQFKAAEGLYLEQNNLEAGFPETLSSVKKKNKKNYTSNLNVSTTFRLQNGDALSMLC